MALPTKIDDSRLIDIARVLKDCYGEGYAGGHPRMQKLLELNDMSHRELLSGEGETAAFSAHEYVKLHQSTLRKVNEISNILTMACEDQLKTASSLIEIYGLHPQSIYELLNGRWWFGIVAFLLGATMGVAVEGVWSF